MQNTQLTNESCLQILNDFILNATAKGVDVVNSLESTNFFMNKARICDALQKENEELKKLIEEKNGNRT